MLVSLSGNFTRTILSALSTAVTILILTILTANRPQFQFRLVPFTAETVLCLVNEILAAERAELSSRTVCPAARKTLPGRVAETVRANRLYALSFFAANSFASAAVCTGAVTSSCLFPPPRRGT